MTGAEQVERLAGFRCSISRARRGSTASPPTCSGAWSKQCRGQRLGRFTSERVFNPLKMRDTAFWSPAPSWRARAAARHGAQGGTAIKLVGVTAHREGDAGGAGRLSHCCDYVRFSQMLGNGGALDGRRLLSPTTVRLMTSDHLGPRMEVVPTPGGGVLGASATVSASASPSAPATASLRGLGVGG